MVTKEGSLRLFRALGIDVYLHWSWLIAAFWLFGNSGAKFSSPFFHALEVFGLVAIVLMHEFGHSLAARQVGGNAQHIVLWPLGGVSYNEVPNRPGAQLWTTAAGPLVNVALVPGLMALAAFLARSGLRESVPDLHLAVSNLFGLNVMLLIFNLAPVYPLDGGQMLRAVLWFGMGRTKSLLVAAGIGFVGVAVFALYALSQGNTWFLFIAFMIGSQCAQAWKQAQALRALEAAPRREEYECPHCHTPPPMSPVWSCQRCGQHFDMFATRAVCPRCQAHFAETQCTKCGQWAPLESWRVFGKAVRMQP